MQGAKFLLRFNCVFTLHLPPVLTYNSLPAWYSQSQLGTGAAMTTLLIAKHDF